MFNFFKKSPKKYQVTFRYVNGISQQTTIVYQSQLDFIIKDNTLQVLNIKAI